MYIIGLQAVRVQPRQRRRQRLDNCHVSLVWLFLCIEDVQGAETNGRSPGLLLIRFKRLSCRAQTLTIHVLRIEIMSWQSSFIRATCPRAFSLQAVRAQPRQRQRLGREQHIRGFQRKRGCRLSTREHKCQQQPAGKEY